MTKIALIGADGQLGTDLNLVLQGNYTVYPLTLEDIDISNFESIDICLKPLNPEIIISTAGYHNVAICEKNPEQTFLVNTVGTKYLTDYCFFNDAKLVFFSTDYIFNGESTRPYIEEDLPDPINTYGISKFAAELYITHHLENFLIIRTTGLYGNNRCLGKPTANFVEMILELINGKDSIDFDGQEICCPTYTYDLAEQIMIMLQQDCKGIFHAVNEGPMSWFEFAQEIISQIGASTEIQYKPRVLDMPKTNKDHQFQPLKRPYYTALECQKLKNRGLYRMNSCKGALSRFLSEKINLNAE